MIKFKLLVTLQKLECFCCRNFSGKVLTSKFDGGGLIEHMKYLGFILKPK